MSAPHSIQRQRMAEHDLGYDAARLARLRIDAEFAALASVALDPARLWPGFLSAGGSLDLFDVPTHRAAYLVFHRLHRKGMPACARWIVRAWQYTYGEQGYADAVRLLDAYPPNPARVELLVRRLIQIDRAQDGMTRRLAEARAILNRSLAVYGTHPYMTWEAA